MRLIALFRTTAATAANPKIPIRPGRVRTTRFDTVDLQHTAAVGHT